MNKVSNLNLFLISLLSLVLGIILIVATSDILTVFNYIFVCIFAICGVIWLISFFVSKDYVDYEYGIVFIWLSLVMYVYYTMIINILPIIFSLYLFIMGAFMIVSYFTKKKSNIKCLRYLIIGVISIIVGILLIFEPKLGVYTYLKITGVNIIVISLLFFFEIIHNLRTKNG